MFAEGRPFEDVLPALQKHGISGEDVGVLLNDPSSKLLTWVRQGSGESPVRLSALEPPPDARLPSRRAGKRGFLGWLSGVNVIDGLGLFTASDVFELHGVQFSVLPEPVRPVVFGEVVSLQVLALNCSSVPDSLTVRIEAEPGLVQSARHYVLSLDPGVISLAVLPVRICPASSTTVRVEAVFDADEHTAERRWKFPARPYAKPINELISVIAGATAVVAAAGLSPIYLRSNMPANQGSPDALRFRPDLAKPVLATQQAPAFWRMLSLT
jgi:hypothetical protein